MDMDYIDKLSDEEKEFLSKFITEEYSASFDKDNKKNLNKSKKNKKRIYDNNNARNRCITSYLGNFKKLRSTDELDVLNNTVDSLSRTSSISKVAVETNSTTEDNLIELIDLSLKLKK